MTFLEFKVIVADFFKLAKTMNKPEQLEAGHKCVGIAYLSLEGATKNEVYQAGILLTLVTRKVLDAEVDELLAST